MNEDDDQDEDSMAVTKYPCMPSLVALQQMRNRLHLAYVGKKLMKWTAQATGRELRRIAMELAQTSIHFRDEVRDAFILLARARYFFPHLNKMVLEHVGRVPHITVGYKTKSVSGVKVLHYLINEKGKAPYQHLGIAKGGQAILEAKIAWKELLKRSILILELRTSFDQVDKANKNANKKTNVLGKIVIPRAKLSIKYILETLEERAREEFYRFKRILENKRKVKEVCEHGLLPIKCSECRVKAKEEEEDDDMCIMCGAVLQVEEVFEVTEETRNEIEENELKLEEFKAHIDEIVEMTKEIEEKGIVSASVEQFLNTAEQLKEKLERGSEVEILEPVPTDTHLGKLCDACKQLLKKEKESEVTLKTEQLPEPNIYEKPPQMETDLELGTFETEIQEITKVIRIRNEDGSVSEEKRVIKIKREIRAPVKLKPMPLLASNNLSERASRTMYQSSEVSNKSTPYSGRKTVGVIMVKDSKTNRTHKVKSEIIENSPPMVDPIVRHCISYISFSSLVSSSINFSFLSSYESLSVDKIRELPVSNTSFEEILRLFELRTQNSKVAAENLQFHKSCHLTESERNLIARITDNGITRSEHRSKSNNDVREEIKSKLKRTTSFNIYKKSDDENNQSSEN